VRKVLLAVLLGAGMGTGVDAQDRALPAPPMQAFTVEEDPFGGTAAIALAASGLALVGLAANATIVPGQETRVRGGVGLLTGTIAVVTGVVLMAGDESGMGAMTAAMGVLAIYHGNLTLRRYENRVALAPRISLGARPTVGVQFTVAF
jgi:hypothetical protein